MKEHSRALHERQPVSLILAVSMIAAGVVYPVTDSALKHTSPIMIATLRALVGGLILTLALPLLRSRLPRTRRLWVWAFAIGFGNTTLTQVGISVGTARAGAAVASVLLNSSPFFVALIARFGLREPITRLRAIGLVIGFGGVLLVVLADPGNIAHGSQLAIGFVLALLGALGWAGGGLGMRALTQREPDLDVSGHTAAQFLAGGIPLIPLALLDGGSTEWSNPTLIAQLAYLIIGGQVVVYLGFNAALSPLALHPRLRLDVPGPRRRRSHRRRPRKPPRTGRHHRHRRRDHRRRDRQPPTRRSINRHRTRKPTRSGRTMGAGRTRPSGSHPTPQVTASDCRIGLGCRAFFVTGFLASCPPS